MRLKHGWIHSQRGGRDFPDQTQGRFSMWNLISARDANYLLGSILRKNLEHALGQGSQDFRRNRGRRCTLLSEEVAAGGGRKVNGLT